MPRQTSRTIIERKTRLDGTVSEYRCEPLSLEVDRRVHAEAIPASPEEQLALARRLGFEEYPRQTFLQEYRRITRRARRAMERVFYEEG